MDSIRLSLIIWQVKNTRHVLTGFVRDAASSFMRILDLSYMFMRLLSSVNSYPNGYEGLDDVDAAGSSGPAKCYGFAVFGKPMEKARWCGCT